LALKDFLKDLDDEVKAITSSDFEIEIIETDYVPSFSDSSLTYVNLDTNKKKCKRLESCVLYVDIRKSAQISSERMPKTLAKMYTSFVRTMIACARYYGGHVRNIIGDRVMVVFDKADCFTNAVDTAVLMNSVCKHILNKRITSFEFNAGIGIDHGKMLITKSGAIRQGDETEFYRTLVWLGKPANVASRLTDQANKKESYYKKGVREGVHYPLTDVWHWSETTFERFLDKLTPSFSPVLTHKEEYFKTFYTTDMGPYKVNHSPILMTKAVYDGFKSARPNSDIIKNDWFYKQSINVKDYDGEVYGGDVTKTAVKEI